jgi:hypothetical protein
MRLVDSRVLRSRSFVTRSRSTTSLTGHWRHLRTTAPAEFNCARGATAHRREAGRGRFSWRRPTTRRWSPPKERLAAGSTGAPTSLA